MKRNKIAYKYFIAKDPRSKGFNILEISLKFGSISIRKTFGWSYSSRVFILLILFEQYLINMWSLVPLHWHSGLKKNIAEKLF